MKRGKFPPPWPVSLWRLLMILWAVALAFLVLALAGMSHFFSALFGDDAVSIAVEMAFFTLSGIFAVLLWRFFSPPQSYLMWLFACLLPILVFIIFLA